MTEAKTSNPGRLVLIDGSGYIFRAFHALPPLSRKRDGLPTGAVAGFCNMLNKLLDDARAAGDVAYFAVVFDTARASFRNEIYTDYKAHRPPPPDDLIPQFPLVRDATRAFNVASVELAGFEADDVIATYARLGREAGLEVLIMSSDKDMMQLVGDGVSMHDPMKQRHIGPREVEERFGVGPDKVIEVQALAGDSSDNVPGVPGIGVKTAAQLINDFGDLDSLLARAGEIKQPKRRQNLIEHAELARVSRQLVTLRDDAPVTETLDDLVLAEPDPEALFAFLEELELGKLAARLGRRFESSEAPAAVTEPAQRDYRAVQKLADLEEWIERARRTGIVAVDTETTSLDTMRAELVGVSLCIDPGRACYIPLGHSGADGQGMLDLLEGGGGESAPEQIPLDNALELLKPLLEDPAVLKVGQNIKYDMAILARYGIDIDPIDDTMVLSFVLDAGLHGHGMDALAETHLGFKPIPFKEVAGSGKSQVTFDRVPLEKAIEYAAEDADVTLRLYRLLKPRLVTERQTTLYETIERPLVPVLLAMENAGIRVDPAALATLSDDFARRMAELEVEIHGLAGRPFNLASPKQLGEILFDEMGLAGGKKTKTGAYQTGHEVLEDLAAQGHELPARILDWRQLQKLKSTYSDTLQGEINARTGRVHTTFHMAAANTGRLASSDPNLQNIPIRTEEGRKIRRAFVPAKGCRLLSADYSQIELRLLAHVAGIEVLIEAFHDGADIHALTASQVFGEPLEDMDPALRRRAKAINFGIIYGISAFGLARQLGIARGEAQQTIEAYFVQYPGIRAYMDSTKEFCRRTGYVETIFGRRCHLPGINDKNQARRGFSERAAINAPLQGSAADIVKRAMIRVPPALAAKGLGARMLLQVHDELLFDVPEAEVEETAAVVKSVMEQAASIRVPLIVDTGLGDNWDEAH
ncbi:MAG: DNA polymerase I [Alphaproteobacteria bacterium]|jgi:DNA polymerase-1|nr:DNA polymerase I [Rhodospirillaceae bacterium]MDP6407148.1 DNA polymerase I [Alphaproteobacteria bacterium]MDP6624316.1 DNA polymerase I [Alphaproteobacteria bacterium]|tara:strand:- start:68 stop:2848 length:2781 start_codon:yes stop_codon:yes gene_type:complete